MCGISCIFSEAKIPNSEIKNLNNAIIHRGPDDEGYLFHSDKDPIFAYGDDTPEEAKINLNLKDINSLNGAGYKVMLAHRRLSIVDTSWRGHQPMVSKCKEYSIVYNGELYNSEEIMKDLKSLGVSFSTNCDTEVILSAFINYGDECLKTFNGMFSFVVYNHIKRHVFFARDRFGIKPLYYSYLNDGTIAFASEIKQFSKLAGWMPEVNKARAIDYLNWGQTDHTNETLFKNVNQVPAGHFGEFSLSSIPKKLTFRSWYSLEGGISELDYDKSITKFKKIFNESIQRHLKADVPIGTCLSGGLDSSSIVCTINKTANLKTKQVTFSSCSSDEKYDESEYVDYVLKECTNIEPHKFEINHDEFWLDLKTLIYHHDEPFLSPSVYAEWCVFKEVKKTNVKVTLDGHGADEILLGYYTFFAPYLSGLIRKLRFAEYWKAVIGIRNMHGWKLSKLLAMTIRSFLPNWIKVSALKILGRPTLYSDWVNTKIFPKQSRLDIGMTDKYAEEVSLGQLFHFSVPKQLKWCDRDSMAHSIESRIPFLDYKLVDFIYSIPVDYKMKRGVTKKILRDSLSGVIPKKIEKRVNKMGFVTPGEKWVMENPKLYKDKLDNAINISGDFFIKDKCKKRFYDMIEQRRPFDNSFWRVIFFAEWIKCYNVKI